MPRQFKTVDYEQALDQSVRLRDVLPPDHLARFVADLVAQLDLAGFYARYAQHGAAPYAPEVLLSLLFYGYATGVFSSRKIEQATYDQAPFRFLAGHQHPDHDTIANFRSQFLDLLPEVFVQLLLLAAASGVLQLGNLLLSGDGTKIHANASKHQAVSYGYLDKLEMRLRGQIASLLERGAAADAAPLPDGLVIESEIADRQAQLTRLAQAREVLQARAAERDRAAQAAYAAARRERAARTARTGKKPRGRGPQPPSTSGPQAGDQYNFTDPDSRVMKNPNDAGFEQAYNAQLLVEQASLLIVGYSLCNQPSDVGQLQPTLESVPNQLEVVATAHDAGYWSEENAAWLSSKGIDGYIATGRREHERNWQEWFEAAEPAEPGAAATARERMDYKLRTALGKLIYRGRKCTVEPVIGIIKAAIGFRQFSLRGAVKAAGEWCLVCLAYNLKHLHSLSLG